MVKQEILLAGSDAHLLRQAASCLAPSCSVRIANPAADAKRLLSQRAAALLLLCGESIGCRELAACSSCRVCCICDQACAAAGEKIQREQLSQLTAPAPQTDTPGWPQTADEFCRNLSHDLKGPTQNILQLLELYPSASKEEANQLIGLIRGEAEQVLQKLERLRVYSRVGYLPLHLQPVCCRPLAEQAMRRRQLEGSCEEIPPVWGDPSLLLQLLNEALDNCQKFARPNLRPVVRITGRACTEGVSLVISDNGVGFDPACADRLFCLFERAHTREEFPGWGAGLAIVRRAAERMQGRVTIAARPGQGCRLEILLPAAG